MFSKVDAETSTCCWLPHTGYRWGWGERESTGKDTELNFGEKMLRNQTTAPSFLAVIWFGFIWPTKEIFITLVLKKQLLVEEVGKAPMVNSPEKGHSSRDIF